MWLIIFGLMIFAMFAGVFYLVNRFYKIPITEKLSGGRKPVRILIAVIPLAVIVGGCWLAWGMTNAIVVSLHVCAVWLIADLISFIVRKIRKKDGNYTVRAVSVLAFSAVYLGVGWYLAHHVWRTQYNVETDKTFGELRIVQISDSHVGATFHADGFAEQIERINAETPDIVVVTGDFVDDGTSLADMEESSKALGDLKTKYGVYFVFGNHDKGYYGDERRGYSTADLVANLEANNVTVLEDENVLIDDRFYLIGRQDASEESRAEMSELFKEIDNSRYTIVLDHQPNDYDAEEAVGADMVLSGHTHGGQLIPASSVRTSPTVAVPPLIVSALRASTSAGFFSMIVLATAFTKFLISSVFAAKSVSVFTSRRTPTLPFTTAVTTPSAAALPLFLACVASPFSLRNSTALSISPSLASRAFLQSIMPTPVDFISSLISATETFAIVITSKI